MQNHGTFRIQLHSTPDWLPLLLVLGSEIAFKYDLAASDLPKISAFYNFQKLWIHWPRMLSLGQSSANLKQYQN